jgi:hypothetical protein
MTLRRYRLQCAQDVRACVGVWKVGGLVPFLMHSESSMDGWVARDRAKDVELGANVRRQVER